MDIVIVSMKQFLVVSELEFNNSQQQKITQLCQVINLEVRESESFKAREKE